MGYFCHLDTSGPETNLQLYSLRQAEYYWNELISEILKDEKFTKTVEKNN